MARRIQKDMESLAREIVHRGEGLSRIERLLFWARLLQLSDPGRALTAMESSSDPTDCACFLRATTEGNAAARLAVTVDLALASLDESSQEVAAFGRTPLGQRIFVWHDWPSFEMDLQRWMAALPKQDLERELKRRVAAGLPEATAAQLAKFAAPIS